MALPIVEHYIQLKSEFVSLFIRHKILILASIVISVSLVLFGVWAMRLRENILAKMKSAQNTPADTVYRAATPPVSSSSALTDILGTPDDATSVDAGDNTFPTLTPFPILTLPPLPVITPIHVTTTYTSSPSSCVGTPTVDNSQVYVSPSTTQVNNAATISVELSDCNNTIAPVSDTLTIALVSGDSGTKINGSSAPVTIETKNGKVSFSVTSSNATTATFLITDTTRSFPVTTPGYHNPSVTFTSGSSGNANCTTSAGAPNSWYSDVYPNPPITSTTGSVTLQVVIRDCFKNTTSVGDSLTISLASGDSGTQVNGNNLPYTLSSQNGQANFTVTSLTTGTVTLVITDTTSSFTVTDPNNHNPSITFSGVSTSTPTGTPTPTLSDTPTPTPETVTPTDTPTPTSSDTPTPTSTPGS